MIPGYELIDELAGNETFRLYRGRHTSSGTSVLIKAPRHDPPWAAELAALRRECEIVKSLSVETVSQPLVIEFPHGCVAIMEDTGGMPLTSPVATGRSELGPVLSIGIELVAIVDELHHRGMMHNGIRPGVIMWDPERRCARLIDFSDVTTYAADRPAWAVQSMSAARLTYVSPEQTGRMNRVADYRSDFYSIGVVLYELLTGAPPFRSTDALELIHSHVARTPPMPAGINAEVPEPVSNIVMRLLAKTPEERYQSALALREDLEFCMQQWTSFGSIVLFPLGRRDIGDHFVISQKLYGREHEVKTLLDAFDRACQGGGKASSILVVAGYSGIGKTSLIQEIYRPIVRKKAYFISGKFDQVVRNIPLGALVQALRALVRQLLTESETRLAVWRATFAQALGTNAAVLAEVIPEIEIVIGKQLPPVALAPMEALNRFQLVFQKFIAAIAQPAHPLVVFLDDLQWADAATLSLLEPLLTSPEIPCLLVIGAYRDNEVDKAHPLLQTFAALESAGIEVEHVVLGPLQLPDLMLLIGDTLHREADDVESLARLVQAKTAGNPFFVTQFLKVLKEDGYLRFDDVEGRWIYRIEAIEGAPMTDNVIDLMTRKIQRLSATTRRVLSLAACIGNPFDQNTLAIVSEQLPASTADDLGEAINEGLIQTRGHLDESTTTPEREAAVPVYAFLHDRVQQSVYALIPAEQKPSVHLMVGRLLRSRTPAERVDEKIFDIVHHWNLGRSLVTEAAERLVLARLNLRAGRKAKSSTAYAAALDYLRAALGLLTKDHWDSDYELSFAIHVEAAECEYLGGHFEQAESHLDFLRGRAQSPQDQVHVQNLRLLQHESQSRYEEAIHIGHHALALCGFSFPATVGERRAALDAEVAAIQARVSGCHVAELGDLPKMTDAMTCMMMQLFTNLHTSCYLSGDKTLTMLNTAYMVRLSLTHGNCSESAYAYALYAAMLMVPIQRDYQSAYEFGQLALRVNDRFPAPAIRARVMMNLGWAVNLWRRPMRESIAISREAHRLGNDNGMFVEATYALFNDCWLSLLSCPKLYRFQETCTPNASYARRVGMHHFAAAPQTILQWGLALQGRTERPVSLTSPDFDEEKFLRDYAGQPLFEMFYCVAKLALLYTFEDYRGAREVARRAEEIIRDFPGTIWDEQTTYYHALTLIELYPELSEAERRDAENKLETNSERLRQWGANATENFALPHTILCAELARLRNDEARAIDLFETATSMPSECLRETALANELFGRFWLRRRNLKLAGLYLREAHTLYGEWGALAKVSDLERRYPDVLGRSASQPSRVPLEAGVAATPTPAGADAGALDLFSVMKAAQAIAGEIDLEQLLGRLIRIAIENAGAERGSLLLERDGESFVQAEGSLHFATVKLNDGVSLSDARDLPVSIVNYVRRTSEAVVLANAQADDTYGDDAYIVASKPRSVMCVPVVKQGRLIGVLYLENNMVCGAFTPDRIRIVQMLSTEAAISLENARLIDGLKQEIRERKVTTEKLHAALSEVEQLKNELEAENIYLRRDLIANVSHDLRTPLTSLRGYLETLLIMEDSLPVAKRRSYLEIAARQSEHLATLVEELFELARLDFKGMQLNQESLHLGELACDVLQKFQLAADKKQVNLKVEAPERIPFVRADLSLLERVLENLIGNALKHTPAGGSVSVSVTPNSDRVVARVTDTGCGMPEAEIPHIFDRFYRVDKSRNTASGGAGLGLAITKRILELHASEITVESTPMVGTCFSFSLPVSEVRKSS